LKDERKQLLLKLLKCHKNKKIKMMSEERNKILEELRQHSEKEFDKLLVYLNSGALVISLAFVENIIPFENASALICLKCSWILFGLSLTIVLLSHKSATASMKYELINKKKISDTLDNLTKILNNLSFISFIMGLFIFIYFILKNV